MQVAKWGNSLAIRLPQAVVKALKLKEGDKIEITIAGTRRFEVARDRSREQALARPASIAVVYRPGSSLIETRRMRAAEIFFDTNVLLYLLSENAGKADRAEKLLSSGGVISVQVLNEFASVALGKKAVNFMELREILPTIRAICSVKSLDVETHELGLDLAERYRFSIYDSLILAAALRAGCSTLYSEDMQDGQKIERLTIRNPFVV